MEDITYHPQHAIMLQLAGVILAVELIATREQPIHVIYAPATGIQTHHGARSLALIQCQGLLSRFHQRKPSLVQLCRAIEELIDDHFLIVRSPHPTPLATAPIALLGKIAKAFKGSFLPAGHATHIHIQDLILRGIVMAISLTMLAID